VRTQQCGATIAAYSGTADAINNAIAACPPGRFVHLGAGRFTLSSMVNFGRRSLVTLRGSGPTKTILAFAANAPGHCASSPGVTDVCMGYSNYHADYPQHSTSWTAGYAQGAKELTLGSAEGLRPGQMIILDQVNDLLDTGSVFVCDNIMADAQHTGCSNSGSGGFGSPGRSLNGVHLNQQEYKLLTAVNGNNITISPPLYMMNWRSSQTPGVWWTSDVLQRDGLEDLTLDHSASSGTINSQGGGPLIVWHAYNCWVKNVRSIRGARNHVWIQYSARITIKDSYFWGTQNSASLSYGVEPWMSGDLLIQNNIFHTIVTPLLIGMSTGSVYGYNYGVFNQTFSTNPAWQMPGPPWVHDVAMLDLIEGNEGTGYIQDAIHGTNMLFTVFRNYFNGYQDPVKTDQTIVLKLQSHARYNNLIGNVLGTAGRHNAYEVNFPATQNCNTAIYTMGWGEGSGNCTSDPIVPNDPLVHSSLLRWGNYDTVTGGVRFEASEVPTGAPALPNPVPASQTLPQSFYTSCAEMAHWWGTPWGNPPCPAIGPDVTGGLLSAGTGPAASLGGHAHAIPAHMCFTNTLPDTHYGTAHPISAAHGTDNSATITIGAAAHDVIIADSITVTGFSGGAAGYNCLHCVVLSKTADSITYQTPANPGVFSAGGSARYPDVLAFDADACYTAAPAPPTECNCKR
jgi:hypothetical protein